MLLFLLEAVSLDDGLDGADMPREGTTVEAKNPARVISTDVT